MLFKEDSFNYQMKQIVEEFKQQFEELQDLTGEELQDKIWTEYADEFGRAVINRCNEYSGNEVFE